MFRHTVTGSIVMMIVFSLSGMLAALVALAGSYDAPSFLVESTHRSTPDYRLVEARIKTCRMVCMGCRVIMDSLCCYRLLGHSAPGVA